MSCRVTSAGGQENDEVSLCNFFQQSVAICSGMHSPDDEDDFPLYVFPQLPAFLSNGSPPAASTWLWGELRGRKGSKQTGGEGMEQCPTLVATAHG